MAGGGEFSDHNHLLAVSEGELETTHSPRSSRLSSGKGGIKDLLIHLDRGLSGRRLSFKRDRDRDRDGDRDHHEEYGAGGDAPPEWALLLIGCFLGLLTGLCVAAFNRGVHIIHEWAWAGTPNEGAAWLRLQRLADTWHRILLIPVTGGVIVGMMHGLVEILEQIKQSTSTQKQGFDLLSAVFPTVN